MARISQPAASASAASAGPDRSSDSRRETEVETVRIAVRIGGTLVGELAEAGHVDVPPREQDARAAALRLDLTLQQRGER